MNYTPVKPPKIIKRIFSNLIWEYPNKDKVIYLTFDDGPTPEITEWVLSTLKAYNAKATFFCIGKNIEAYPNIFEQIINLGHRIGNHTHDHLKGWKNTTKAYLTNIDHTEAEIKKYNYDSKLFRPPYGQITPRQAKQLIKKGYQIVMWSVLSIDWDKNVTKEQCLKNVIKHTKSGDIIVFHDSVKASKNMTYALPKVLDYYTKKGYKFKCIPE